MRDVPASLLLAFAAGNAPFVSAFSPSSGGGPASRLIAPPSIRSGAAAGFEVGVGGVRSIGPSTTHLLAVDEKQSSSSSPTSAEGLGNFFSSLFGGGGASPSPAPMIEETPEQRLLRLELERRAELEAGEVLRADRVAEDKYAYLALFALQLLPLVGLDRWETVSYFLGTAVLTVYLGGRQETVGEVERIEKENALYAPLGASAAIGGLYALIKLGLDPTSLYAIGVSLVGAIAISDVGVPLLRNVVPDSFAKGEVEVPEPLAEKLKLNPPTLPVDGLTTLALGIVCTLAYWSPVAMTQKFMVSNIIAWSLAMTSLGAISLGSFQTGAILLAGLFCYDIFWVFGTDVMMTVATKVEAPVKFLYANPPELAEGKSYPFSVLGLGDVVIPGLFVRFMSKVDEALKPAVGSYFTAATAAYAVGLASCFVVNEITHAGQPALLYLDPACVGSALAVGAANGQLSEVWNFEEERPEAEPEEVEGSIEVESR
eukprot:CAMPEP_0113547978 /NCGR_PEP_ID=MMETSP0015_2-20120614/12647_1 /TAXON_ID=2838 /ORGANISM="Odontella" /LENGTH=485 /DNA_ID=CAMNT_0000448575 /DNA_START=50 /DNA_END=1507 /DNA_ORIENTATION=+ /assembly_acc=CAM_ASM_000160